MRRINRLCLAVVAMFYVGLTGYAEEVATVYKTGFDSHYFDNGTFAKGPLADDGWEAPQNNPAQVISDGGGGQIVQGSGYNSNRLNLESKGKDISNKVVTISFKQCWHRPTSTERYACWAYSGGEEIGHVEFTSGSEKGGLVTLVGEETFKAADVTPGGQLIKWKINLIKKTMSLSVDGGTAAVTSFKDTSLSTLSSMDFGWGNDVLSQVDDLSIIATDKDEDSGQVKVSNPQVISPASVNSSPQVSNSAQLQMGDISADILNGQFRIFRGGALVLREQVDGLIEGAGVQENIQGTGLSGRGINWKSSSKSFKKIIVLKKNEVLIEYLVDIDSEQKIPDWSISLFLPQAKWGKIDNYAVSPGCPDSIWVGNRLELQVGEGSKMIGHYAHREELSWKLNQNPVDGEYSLVLTNGFAEDPGRLRRVVRLVFDGPGVENGAPDRGYFDRGNPQGNLNQIADRHFTILACRDRKYCFPGEKVNVTLKYISDDSEARKIPIEYSLVDAWGKQLDYGVFVFDTTKGDSHAITFLPTELGVYRWHFRYTWDTVKRENEAVFAVMPKVEEKKSSDIGSILGSHIPLYIYGDGRGQPYLDRLWKVMGMQWNRWWDISAAVLWAGFEPVEGKYDFSGADAVWRSDQKRGAFTLAVLPQYYFPQWAKEKMGIIDVNTTKLQRENPGEYARIYSQQYVKPFVEHFKGKIKYWETANESWWQFNGFEKDYIHVLKQSYEVIKGIDPSNQVVGICGYGYGQPLDYLRNLFKLGALKYLDILSIHFYIFPEPPDGRRETDIFAGDELLVQKHIQDVKSMMREYGEEKPLWDTESMIAPYGNMYTVPSQRQNFFPIPISPGKVYGAVDTPVYAAANVVKGLVIRFIENVKWFYYVFYPSCHASSFCEYDGTPLAMGVAWTQFAREMEGAKYVETLEPRKKNVQAYLFERAGKPIVMLWGTYFKPDYVVTLKTQLKANQVIIRDLLGNSVEGVPNNDGLSINLTVYPIYLIGEDITGKELKVELERAITGAWEQITQAAE